MSSNEGAFWRFVYERQMVFERRRLGGAAPWTRDPVLAQYRFCNVYRAADRVSQYTLRNVLYAPDASKEPAEVAFRAVLFRLFNYPWTWKYLKDYLREQPSLKNFDADRYGAWLTAAQSEGHQLWTGAYIVRAPVDIMRGKSGEPKHVGWLNIVAQMVKDQLFQYISSDERLETIYARLRQYPYVGDFTAMQWTTDIGYADIPSLREANENDFIILGPGAVRGAVKVFGEFKSAAQLYDLLWEQHWAFNSIGVHFPKLGGKRALSAMDLQNCLCEFDKYSRVALPDLNAGLNSPKQIKQKFDATAAQHHAPINYFWPPKWGLSASVGVA